MISNLMEEVVRYTWILCLFVVGTAFAQSVPPSQPSPQHRPAVADDDDDDDDGRATAPITSTLMARTPVITVKGTCGSGTGKISAASRSSNLKTECQTVVTRGEFETLVDAVQPGMSAAKRQQLAETYAKFLAMSHEAKKLGLNKGAHYEELMDYARAQILAQELDRYLQSEALKTSEEDAVAYYRTNSPLFEQASFERIFIPHSRQIQAAGTRDAMKQEADSIHARAVAGESFEALQKEAFASAGLKGTTSTNLVGVRLGSLPASHGVEFELKPTEVSEVLADSTGFYVYKMLNKTLLPMDQVRDEIASQLRDARMKQLTRGVQQSSSIELNEAYFAPAASASLSGTKAVAEP